MRSLHGVDQILDTLQEGANLGEDFGQVWLNYPSGISGS